MAMPPRRPYTPPRLAIYGDLRAVTLANISMAMNDPGSGSTSMT